MNICISCVIDSAACIITVRHFKLVATSGASSCCCFAVLLLECHDGMIKWSGDEGKSD